MFHQIIVFFCRYKLQNPIHITSKTKFDDFHFVLKSDCMAANLGQTWMVWNVHNNIIWRPPMLMNVQFHHLNGLECKYMIWQQLCWWTAMPSLTKSTLGISSPRAATSVATSTVNFPFLKLFKVLSLWCCDMSPCSASEVMLLVKARETSSASRFVCVKTIVFPPFA